MRLGKSTENICHDQLWLCMQQEDPRVLVQRPNRQRNIGNAYALYKNSTSDIEVSSPFYMSLKLL